MVSSVVLVGGPGRDVVSQVLGNVAGGHTMSQNCLEVQGCMQRGFAGGSPNPAGGLGGAVSPPAGSGAEPRKILK